MVSLKAGERVEVECSYENPGAEPVPFGDSSLDEMCFAGLYRYPRGEGGMVCSTSAGPTIEGPPCAKPGAPGNEKGVGKLCSEGGGECSGSAPLCIADYADGDFANFCTVVCTDDTECGTGAICLGSGGTAVCLPTACLETLG